MKPLNQGYTLIELAVFLTVVMIVTGIAAPTLSAMIERNKAAVGINWIIRAINLTRITAVETGSLTTLCPTEDDRTCGGPWHQRIMIFTDQNDDRMINGADKLITFLDFPAEGSTLKWRAFRNRQYLQMTGSGFTNFQNGNFVYCSKDQRPEFSRQIVLNLQGRVKSSYDRNDDGVVEDRNGHPLRC